MNTKVKKWKKTVILIEINIDVLKRLDKRLSIEKYIGVVEVTFEDWKINRVQIEKFCADKANCRNDKKTMKHCEF